MLVAIDQAASFMYMPGKSVPGLLEKKALKLKNAMMTSRISMNLKWRSSMNGLENWTLNIQSMGRYEWL